MAATSRGRTRAAKEAWRERLAARVALLEALARDARGLAETDAEAAPLVAAAERELRLARRMLDEAER